MERSLLARRKADGISPREGRSHRSLLDGPRRSVDRGIHEERREADARGGDRRREPAGLGRLTYLVRRSRLRTSLVCSCDKSFTRALQRATRASKVPWLDALVRLEKSIAMSTASR